MPTQIHSSRGQGYPHTSNGSYLANLSLQELKGSSQSAFSDTVPGNRMNHQILESLANYTYRCNANVTLNCSNFREDPLNLTQDKNSRWHRKD